MESITSSHGTSQGMKHALGRKYIFIITGPVLCMLMLILPSPAGMTPEATKVAAVALMMVVWWITEAVPIAVTALLPLIMLPLVGFSSIAEAAGGYSSHLIFLFLGGFVIALALERWNVHKRIAWAILAALGTSSRRILLGFMLATGFVSMWISNTATTMMMLPIASAVISQFPNLIHKEYSQSEVSETSLSHKRIGTAIMLGIAYAASIGGMGTIIGTPPNLVLAGALKELLQYELNFINWMMIGVPLAVVFIFLVWILFVKIFKLSSKDIPGADVVIAQKRKELGPISANETMVLIVFIITALSWITRKWLIQPLLPKVNDSVIALIGAVLLFVIPVSKDTRNEQGLFIMDWASAVKLPWGIVLLFGGGFSLAKAFTKSELSLWIGEQLTGLAGAPIIIVVASIVLLVTFLTEITSNTASATLLMPIMAAFASTLNFSPVVIMATAAIAASCAFMFPVATPPNAIVFSTGKITIRDMACVGIILNIVSVILVTATAMTLIPLFLQ